MQPNLAYVVAAKSDLPKAVTSPRFEYSVYKETYAPLMLDLGYLEREHNFIVRSLVNRKRFGYAFALIMGSVDLSSPSYLFSGEDLGLPAALLDVITPRRSNIYIIMHGSYMASGKFKMLMKLLRLRRNVHFLCLSESIRQVMINDFGANPSRAHNTGYGVDTVFFEPTEKVGSPLIVSAGAASRDYTTLIAATVPLGVPVRIAADSAWFPTAVEHDPSSLPSFIDVRSAGNYEGLRKLYADASFVVVPLKNVKHACGYAVIGEAMAMGRAVIATRTYTPSDFITDGETGFLVEPGDVEGLRSRIEWCLDHTEEVMCMGNKARRLMETSFSVEAYCAKMASVIVSTS